MIWNRIGRPAAQRWTALSLASPAGRAAVQHRPLTGTPANADAQALAAGIARTWMERADRIEDTNVFRRLQLQSLQRTRCAALQRPPKPVIDGDAMATGILRGLQPELAVVLAGTGPGVRAGLERLAPTAGHQVGFTDPPDLRLVLTLAARGCLCHVSLSDPLALVEVDRQLAAWRAGQANDPLTGQANGQVKGADVARARDIASRVRLKDGQGMAAVGAAPGSLRTVVSLSTLQRLPDIRAVSRDLEAAGTQLAPGGGLVIEFMHAAGGPMYPLTPRLTLPAFSDLAATAQQQGLSLAHLAIGCTPMADGPRPPAFSQTLTPDPGSGTISLAAADEAAWAAWMPLLWSSQHDGRPIEFRVSGLFVKQGG